MTKLEPWDPASPVPGAAVRGGEGTWAFSALSSVTFPEDVTVLSWNVSSESSVFIFTSLDLVSRQAQNIQGL